MEGKFKIQLVKKRRENTMLKSTDSDIVYNLDELALERFGSEKSVSTDEFVKFLEHISKQICEKAEWSPWEEKYCSKTAAEMDVLRAKVVKNTGVTVVDKANFKRSRGGYLSKKS